jgi:hypothetical protein
VRTHVVTRSLALLITALVIALPIRYNTFAAWGTDSGAYLSQGRAWADADLFLPATFLNWADWTLDGAMEAPLGHVYGAIHGTVTGQYPLGYPLLIAVAMKIGGELAAHVVSPILGGMMTWCAFLLGRRMATPWGGVMAAALVAATPIAFEHAMMPFSDVPAAAFWTLAWVMSVRAGSGAAAASGAAVAMAVMIRPNLAPLALVIAAVVLVADRKSWRHGLQRTIVFGLFAALGPLVVMWSQAVLYGHPMQSGYRVPLDYFFRAERIPYNASLYPRTLLGLHSWFAFGGLLFVPVAVRGMRVDPHQYIRGVLALSALALILINYALYLPYLTYVGPQWLRFFLPAIVALLVLLAAGLDHLRRWLAGRWPKVAVLAVVPAVVVIWTAREHFRAPIGFERILMMQRYLAEALPPNATILAYAHGAALAGTGRWTLRLDLIEPAQLERIIDELQRHGHRPAYVFDVAVEAGWFGYRFQGVPLARLTWPARAEINSVTSVIAYDLQDRERFFSGDRWPTDLLAYPPAATATVQWSAMRIPHERIVLPLPEETAAFRTMLDRIYRDQLGRAPFAPAVDPLGVMTWMRRYVRLRLHGCSHEIAGRKLWEQMETGHAPSLCAQPASVSFPPQDETVTFRQQLEIKLPPASARVVPTSVDPVGEAVWLQTYLEARVAGCSHADATAEVEARITGVGSRCPG